MEQCRRDILHKQLPKQQLENICLQLILKVKGSVKGVTSQGKLQSWGVTFTSYFGYCFKWETIKTKEFLSIEQNHIHYMLTFPHCLIRTGSQNGHEFLQLLFINIDLKAYWIPPFSFQLGFFTAPVITFKKSKVHFENTINISFLYVLICEQHICLPVFERETKKKHIFLSNCMSYPVSQNSSITLLRFYQLKPKVDGAHWH